MEFRALVFACASLSLAGCFCSLPECWWGALCGGVCVDTAFDDENCGGCGNWCTGGQTCQGGFCGCRGNSMVCPGEDHCVYGGSVDHCGRCGNACAPGEVCEATSSGGGWGTPASMTYHCAAGCDWGTVCDRVCVDPDTNDAHCGACGSACPSGTSCMGGRCWCSPGVVRCGSRCVYLSSDSANCGACGNLCGDGSYCVGGSCRCEAGRTECDGRCVDLQADARSCGYCGASCGVGELCVDRWCRRACPTGRDCGGRCVEADIACGDHPCGDGRRTDCDERRESVLCQLPPSGAGCGHCNGGTGCAEGAWCFGRAECLEATPLALNVRCGGPYVAGDPPVPCGVALVFADPDIVADVPVTASVVWTSLCDGSPCAAGDPDAPSIAGDGVFTPAGADSPTRIDESVTLVILATYRRGALELSGSARLETVPRGGPGAPDGGL